MAVASGPFEYFVTGELYVHQVYHNDMAIYRVALRKSEEGYSVSCPGLPGCWSQGATEEDALANIRIAIREYVEAAEELARNDDSRVVEVAVA